MSLAGIQKSQLTLIEYQVCLENSSFLATPHGFKVIFDFQFLIDDFKSKFGNRKSTIPMPQALYYQISFQMHDFIWEIRVYK